ncbi:MAG: ABC transporter substrate-binding protein [Desulfovibrionaceae bacterium]
MFRKVFKMAFLAACMLTLAAGPAMAKTVKLAVAAPLTGAAAAYGDNIKAGVSMMVDKVNAAGGVNGMTVEVEYMDEQCEPKEAATVASKIAMDTGIVGVVGHVCSSAHLAALPTYVRKGVPVISATATNVTISQKNADRDGKVWSFRNVYLDDFQGYFLAHYVSEKLGLKKIAVFFENNDYGIGLKDAFVAEAKNMGLAVVGEEAYVKGAQDFTPQLTKLKGQDPDGLFISGYYGEGALIAGQAKKLGMHVVKFGADGIDNADYINLAKEAAEDTYLTVPFLPELATGDAATFVVDYKAKFGRDVDWMSVNAYDAAGLLLKAIGSVGADRAKVQAYLAAMTSADKGYMGVGGNTFFDAKGDCKKNAFVKMVKGGKFVPAPVQMQ